MTEKNLTAAIAVGSGGLVGLLARMFCKLGIHKIRHIRVTHYNAWSGDVCAWISPPQWEDCGEPATHREPVSQLCYCSKHADAFGQSIRLVPLNADSSQPAPKI